MSERFRRAGSPWTLRYVGPNYFIPLWVALTLTTVLSVIWTVAAYKGTLVNKDLAFGIAIAIGPAIALALAARMRRWFEAPLIAFFGYAAAISSWLGCRIYEMGWNFGTAFIDWWAIIMICVTNLLGSLVIWFIVKIVRGTPVVDESRCANCGYSLLGNISGTCPECGTQVTDEPKHTREQIG